MLVKATNTSTSPPINLKSPLFPKQPFISFLKSPLNFKSKHYHKKKPLTFHISKHPSHLNSHKLHCISPTYDSLKETHDPDSEITETNGKKTQSLSQIPDEIVEHSSGKLGVQSFWEKIVDIVKFSGPATGLWICGPLMSLIDTAVVGQGSSIELAALGPGTVLCDHMSFVFMFLSIATSNMVATSLANARQEENKVQHQISMLLFVGLASGVLMLLLTKLFGALALTAFVGPKNVHLVPAANLYIQIRALAWPAILVGNIAQSASLGMKDSMGPLKALLIASIINLIGDIILCTFLGFGIAGAAWATAASQVVAAYTMVDSLTRKGYNCFSILIPSLDELHEVLAIAAPILITMVSKVAFYSLIIYFATSMGTHTVAAHQVLAQIFGICAVWGEPLSQTAQSFMPELLYGVDQSLMKARALLKSLLIIGASVGLVIGTVATSIPWLFPTCFTPDPVVILEMHKVWIYFFLAVCVTPCILSCEGTLLAARDLKFISTSMTGCFALGSLVLMVLRNQGLGLVACWSVLVGFQWARFMISICRLLSPNGVLHSGDLARFRLTELKAA